jgi:hypothetical protein
MDDGIRLWWGIAAGLFVEEMKLPLKEDSSHTVIELSIIKWAFFI